jgi:hypothetical protein
VTTYGEPVRAHGTGDIVAAWLLYAAQLAFELLLFMFLVLSVMAGDSCGSGVEPQPRVCEGDYFATIFFAFGASLVVAALAVPVLIIVAGQRGWYRWLQPVFGIVFLVIATVVYFFFLSR